MPEIDIPAPETPKRRYLLLKPQKMIAVRERRGTSELTKLVEKRRNATQTLMCLVSQESSTRSRIIAWAKSTNGAVSRCYLIRKNGIWQLFVLSSSETRDRTVSRALAELVVQMNQKEGVQIVGRYITLEGETELKDEFGQRLNAAKIWS